MIAGVEIEFSDEPTNNELHFMVLAAEKLSKDPSDIQIQKSDDFPEKATVIFRMKNEAQYKVVDWISDVFKRMIPDHRDMTIWFQQEKAYDLKNSKSED